MSNIGQPQSVSEDRISSIIKNLKKENLGAYSNAIIFFVTGAFMTSTPAFMSAMKETINPENAIVETEKVVESVATVGELAQSLDHSINAMAQFLTMGMSLLGMVFFVIGIIKLKKAADEPSSISLSEFNNYSIVELLYVMNKLSSSKNEKNKELRVELVVYLIKEIKDEKIGSLRFSDIESYILEIDSKKENEAKNQLLKEREEIDKKIKGENITLEDLIELEVD